MKILKYFTLAALTVALMTSCDSNNSNSQTFNMSMLYYTTSASGEAYSLGTTVFKLVIPMCQSARSHQIM